MPSTGSTSPGSRSNVQLRQSCSGPQIPIDSASSSPISRRTIIVRLAHGQPRATTSRYRPASAGSVPSRPSAVIRPSRYLVSLTNSPEAPIPRRYRTPYVFKYLLRLACRYRNTTYAEPFWSVAPDSLGSAPSRQEAAVTGKDPEVTDGTEAARPSSRWLAGTACDPLLARAATAVDDVPDTITGRSGRPRRYMKAGGTLAPVDDGLAAAPYDYERFTTVAGPLGQPEPGQPYRVRYRGINRSRGEWLAIRLITLFLA